MKKYNNAARLRDYTKDYFSMDCALSAEQRDELIIKYSSLIKYLAGKLAMRLPPHIAIDDLISSGTIGLIDAINKFDPAKNIQFKTYAEFRIRGAMLDELRSLDWIPRSVRRKIADIERAYTGLQKELGRPAEDEEVAAKLDLPLKDFYKMVDSVKGVSLLDLSVLRRKTSDNSDDDIFELIADENQTDPYVTINFSQMRDVVASAIDELPEKERLVISLYYYEDLTMREIGEIMGYTESRISQIHTKSVLRLRGALKGHIRHEFQDSDY